MPFSARSFCQFSSNPIVRVFSYNPKVSQCLQTSPQGTERLSLVFPLSQKQGGFRDESTAQHHVKSIQDQILAKTYRKRRGWAFTPKHFLPLGRRTAVAKALSRLTEAGTIPNSARGLYDYPKRHPKPGLH